ncbi:hypothetical protein GOP47_0002140 [Adiantum capillus-veneris]|uniref:Uncharacterized protein n=1 Tax=Adiantum capillus-veneris TaxID=13818 RepID=A0A9D4VA54_ADICA|nr:hypothetical protein GOP47_0002140 [Adiantum capillus-veneris]
MLCYILYVQDTEAEGGGGVAVHGNHRGSRRRGAALQAMAGHIDDEDGQQKNDYYGQDLLGLMLAEMEAAS